MLLTAPGAAVLMLQLLAQLDLLLTAPGAAVLILQLVAQLLAQSALSALTAPGAAVFEQLEAQLLAQLDFSALTAPGAAEEVQLPQQAASPVAPGDAVLLLLQPTRVAARVTAAMVKKVRMG